MRRDDVFVTTKIADDRHDAADLVRSVEQSLERLRTDHVDLLLVHWPSRWDTVAATLDALAETRERGMARRIGLSNFTVAQLDQVRRFAPVDVLQVECHPFLQQLELRAWCQSNGWEFIAYSPLAKGRVVDDDTLRDIAKAHGTTPVTVALAWLLSFDGVATIPRTSKVFHLDAILAAQSVKLSVDDLARIGRLDAGLRLVDPPQAPW